MLVYPNPIRNGVIEANIAYPGDPCNDNVNTNRTNVNIDIEIYDMQSIKKVSKKFNKNKMDISSAGLKKGYYILIAKLENKEPLKKIIIIE